MELAFVGTGAADYETSLGCPCKNCLESRSLGGRNVRTYASLLVDGSLLVDCGATVPWRVAELDAPPERVGHVLITHAHHDHLDAEALRALTVARGDVGPLSVYGNAAVMDKLTEAGLDVEGQEVHPGDEVCVGGFRVLVLPAKHDWENQQTLNFVVESDSASVLYAADTAWPEDEWWRLLADRTLSAAIVEATFGPLDEAGHPDCLSGHLNWEVFAQMAAELRRRGILPEPAPVYATHLSLHWLPIHDRYAAEVETSTERLAYDGLRVTL